MRTLLTGFGPFLDVTDNPSSRIVDHFARRGAPGHELTVHLLPVSFRRTAETMPHILREREYDLALLLGVAARESEFRLERRARNSTGGASPDVDGFAPGDGLIRPGAPDRYETAIPVEELLGMLRASAIPARLSDDAGGYVCNWLYYTALHTIATEGLPTRCLFVHVPPDTGAFPLDRQIEAIGRVLEELATRNG